MADQLQLRGGTTTEHNTFTGASKEVTVDTTKKTAVVHDGATAGGNPLMREDGSNSALALGSQSTPSLKFTGDTNTGIYSPGADQVAISTAGSGRLFVNASGRVGVGVASPAQPLDIVTSAADAYIRQSNGVVTGFVGVNNANSAFDIYTFSNHPTRFFTDNTERLRITSDGKLGLGTSAPTERFQIHTPSSNASYLNITNDTTGSTAGNGVLIGLDSSEQFYIYSYENNNVIFGTNNAERARIDSSGRLLVGSTIAYGDYVGASSGYIGTLQIARNSFDGVAQFSNWTSNTGLDSYGGTQLFISRCKSGTVGSHTGGALSSGNPIGRLIFNTSDGTNFRSSAYITAEVDGAVSTADVPGRLVFSTTADGASTPTERMRIKSSGIVNIANTPTYADNTAALAGGLVAGDVYRKADGTLMITY